MAAPAVDEPLNTAGALSSPWVASGTVTPSIVTAAGNIPLNAMRLTNTDEGQAGFALYNRAISNTAGIDVSFTQAQWGGSDADGIVFFIKKGSDSSTDPGASGGALGYSPNLDGASAGLSGALLGIGLDGHGNFASEGTDGTGCVANAYSRSGAGAANAITVRGPGQGTAGYCMLADSIDVQNDLEQSALVGGYADRAAAARVIRVVVDPANVSNPRVVVYYQGVEAVNVPLPSAFSNVSTIKFGFAAGTGGLTNNHDVWGLTVNSSPRADEASLANTGRDSALTGMIAMGFLAAGAVAMVAGRRKEQ
jgi:LPXTG-motif cell wall-anchored protein